MKRHRFTLSLVLVVVLTLASGMLQGRIRNRWGPSDSMLAAAEKLDGVPGQFGNWRLESSQELDPGAVQMLECTGYVCRRYVNERTGELVSMVLIVGPAGPISVHTPEICYSSQNYKTRDPRQRVAIEDSHATELGQFWTLGFRSKPPRADVLRVYYAWSTGSEWTAPDAPRFAFTGWPYLYKLELSCNQAPGADVARDDACRKFLQAFLPAVKPHLVAPFTP
ncbi:MAG: exosortase-associated EpsI family protein [Thermoguttaceae bacterium]|jgi:hypothetical protein